MSWRRLVAIGSFVADSDGSDFRATQSLAGWEDSAPVRGGGEDRSQQDGGWDASGFYGPRIISYEGRVEQPSRAAALAVVDELQSLSLRSLHQFAVDDPNIGVRSAFVRIVGGATVEWVGPVSFRYSVQLWAADPLKYGDMTVTPTTLAAAAGGAGLPYPEAYPLDYGVPPGVTPGAITLPNAGTAGYWPRLRIDGPVPNPVVTLVETGDFIWYGGTVGAGQWLDIDCANRRVLLNGQVSHRHLVSYGGNWLGVPPGGGSLAWTADAADPAATLTAWGYEGAWS